jgi:predicted transcriptional regulator
MQEGEIMAERKGVPVQVWLEEAEAAKLRGLAERADRSVAAEARRAIRQYLVAQDTGGSEPPAKKGGAK